MHLNLPVEEELEEEVEEERGAIGKGLSWRTENREEEGGVLGTFPWWWIINIVL